MTLNAIQQEQARKQFEENLQDVSEEDVQYAAIKGRKKLEGLGDKPPGALAGLWEDIKTMISMLGDYVSGKYRDITWKTVAAIAGAIAYFVMPIDVIPDVIPVAGYLDDALVIKLALDLASDDLADYRIWHASQA